MLLLSYLGGKILKPTVSNLYPQGGKKATSKKAVVQEEDDSLPF